MGHTTTDEATVSTTLRSRRLWFKLRNKYLIQSLQPSQGRRETCHLLSHTGPALSFLSPFTHMSIRLSAKQTLLGCSCVEGKILQVNKSSHWLFFLNPQRVGHIVRDGVHNHTFYDKTQELARINRLWLTQRRRFNPGRETPFKRRSWKAVLRQRPPRKPRRSLHSDGSYSPDGDWDEDKAGQFQWMEQSASHLLPESSPLEWSQESRALQDATITAGNQWDARANRRNRRKQGQTPEFTICSDDVMPIADNHLTAS